MLVALSAALILTLAAVVEAGADGRPLATALTGAQEAPGPGDPDASGTAAIQLNQGQGTVCFQLAWEDIDGEVFAAHIHVAPPGDPGPIVVDLFVNASFAGTDSASGCTTGVDRDLIKAIRQDPGAYYVNVHSTPDFPGGAIRGQLSK
jgi:hypothetical protein